MADSEEDFEPLFNYSRVQPISFVCLDDDSSDVYPVPSQKRRKISKPVVKEVEEDVKIIEVANSKDSDEEDWLPPPPKVSADLQKRFRDDSTIKELRLKKQELESLVAKSAEVLLQAVEESVKRDLSSSLQSSPGGVEEQSSKPPCRRAKIVISIQDKDGPKQFRLYRDDKFERLFKTYADKVGLNIQGLVFVFDGDKINPTATPDSLEMEDEDIIEVHVKKAE